jgi:alpha-1,3-mannosyltransferase
MNILLFAPGFALVFLKGTGFLKSIRHGLTVIAVQFLISIPFILEYPMEYLGRSFEFSRQFVYMWSVNWKMIDENSFLSGEFAKILLTLHLLGLSIFISKAAR